MLASGMILGKINNFPGFEWATEPDSLIGTKS
jgi:hypothetical protein